MLSSSPQYYTYFIVSIGQASISSLSSNSMKKQNILEQVEELPSIYKLIFVLLLIVFFVNMSFPRVDFAEPLMKVNLDKRAMELKAVNSTDLLTKKFLEQAQKKVDLQTKKPIRTYTVVATAYSSEVAQTDSTPCITADGYNVCTHNTEDVIAANFLPMNAKVRIPDLYGDQIFTVHDRMNPRYNYRIDLWKKSRNSAITFGKRLVRIEVVEY